MLSVEELRSSMRVLLVRVSCLCSIAIPPGRLDPSAPAARWLDHGARGVRLPDHRILSAPESGADYRTFAAQTAWRLV